MENKNGITLMILVITIILLLILAGISVLLVIDNTGILSKSTKAIEENRMLEAKEKIELSWAACESEYLSGKAADSSIDGKDIFTRENLNKHLSGEGTIKDVKYAENGKSYLTYVDNSNVYTFSIDNSGNIKLSNKTIIIGYFETDYMYNDNHILAIENEFEVDSIEIKDEKLDIKYFSDDEIKNVSLNIVDTYNFNCIDCKELLENDEITPGIVINSNNKIIKDFSECKFEDSYYIVALESEQELQYLLNGNYIIDTGIWLKDWFEKPAIDLSDFCGYYNLTMVPYYCTIYRKISENTEIIFDSKYLQNDFNEAINLFDEIKNLQNISITLDKLENSKTKSITCENSEYKAILHYTIGYEDYPAFSTIWVNDTGSYEFCDISKKLYDIGRIEPYKIKNKVTNKTVKYSSLKTELENDIDNYESICAKYMYYMEEKIHILRQGNKINI